MNIILSFFLIALSVALTKVFCVKAQNTRLMDKPNERSMHHIPKVRGAGLVFIGLFLLSLPIAGYLNQTPLMEQLVLFISVFLLGLISFCDDLYTLSAKPRFAVQCLVAGLAAVIMRPETLDFVLFTLVNKYLVMGLLFFLTLWAINHFNFMDGLDGFCGSQALFLFSAYAVLLGLHGAFFYQELCFILIFGLIAFLAFNLPPAKLFMGDIGSATLGFISFYIALLAQQKYQIPILYWFILNALFLFDSTITLLRRIHKKEQWFSAHRKHAYQRLKQYGLNTYFILLGQLIINVIFLVSILLIQKNTLNINLLLVFIISVLMFVYRLIENLYPMFHSHVHK